MNNKAVLSLGILVCILIVTATTDWTDTKISSTLITATTINGSNITGSTFYDDGVLLVKTGDAGKVTVTEKNVTVGANWDIGSYSFTAETLISDVLTGTAPLTISSTTVVSNLNADQVDGIDSTDVVLVDGSQDMTGDLNITSNDVVSVNCIKFDNGAEICGVV